MNKNLELESQTISAILFYFILLDRKSRVNISIVIFGQYHFIFKHSILNLFPFLSDSL